MTRYLFASLSMLAALACISCNANKHPAAASPLKADMTQFSGNILAPSTQPAKLQSESAAPVSVEVMLLPAMPRNTLKPFGASSTLLTAIGGDNAILAVPESLALARLGSGPDAQWMYREARSGTFGKSTSLGSFTGVLAPNVSLRCALDAVATKTPDLQIILEQPASGQAALQVGLVARFMAAATDDGAEQQPIEHWETAVASVPVQSTETEVAVLVPRPTGTVLVHISLGSRGTGVTNAALETARAQLATAVMRPELISTQQLMLQASLKAMATPGARRAAIANLASQTHATLCQDLVASADDQTLAALSDQFAQELPKASPDDLGWTMDHIAFDYLGKLRIDGKLSPDLDTVLTVYAGEAGHSVTSMEQLVGKTTTRQNLHERLIAENYIYLEETSPASRVRAYDWLASQGKAPPGYDPMGLPQERRKALDTAIENMSNNPVPTTNPSNAGGSL